MQRKFFFFDIDGTITVWKPEKYIPKSTIYTIKKLQEQGHVVCIATGRAYSLCKDYMDELGICHMVSDGGNGVTINGKLLGIEPLNYDLCLKLIDECERKGFPYAISYDDRLYRSAPNDDFYNFTKDIYMPTKTIKNFNIHDYHEIYKMYIACLKGEEQQLECLNDLPWGRYFEKYIFVEPSDKSVGIRKIVDYFGGDYKDVVVFGDETNDLTMFLDEWTSIAMGNAIDEVKNKADFVTKDAIDDGIYYACQHFGWID